MVELVENLVDTKEKVFCRLCGKYSARIVPAHLKTHGVSCAEYKAKGWPLLSKSTSDKISVNSKLMHAKRVALGVPNFGHRDWFLKNIAVDLRLDKPKSICLNCPKPTRGKFCSCKCSNLYYGKGSRERMLRINKQRLEDLKSGKLIHFSKLPGAAESFAKISAGKKGQKTWNTGLTKETDARVKKYGQDLKNNPKAKAQRLARGKKGGQATAAHIASDPEFRKYFIENVVAKSLLKQLENVENGKFSEYEQRFEDLSKEYNLGFKYTGNMSLWLTSNGEHFNPDFVHLDKRIAVEVYADYWKIKNYGSVENYISIRTKLLNDIAWKVVFLNEHDLFSENWKEHCLAKLTNCKVIGV